MATLRDIRRRITSVEKTQQITSAMRMVAARGAVVHTHVSAKTDYLIVGSKGSPTWAYGSYGRKIAQAKKLRQAGGGILIVREGDFWDGVDG